MKPSEYITRGWCQGAVARDIEGQPTGAERPTACTWCLMGAVIAAYPYDPCKRTNIWDCLDKQSIMLPAEWNDDPKRKQSEVVSLLQSIGE